MLQERDNALCMAQPHRTPSHFFNTFFMDKLQGVSRKIVLDAEGREKIIFDGPNKFSYENVTRWTRDVDIFALENIYIPFNIEDWHWAIIIVFMASKKIIHFDSYHQDGSQHVADVKKWIEMEMDAKKRMTMDWSKWDFDTRPCGPQQHASNDCALFALMAAAFTLDGLEFNYSQSLMNTINIRKIICYQILYGTLNGY